MTRSELDAWLVNVPAEGCAAIVADLEARKREAMTLALALESLACAGNALIGEWSKPFSPAQAAFLRAALDAAEAIGGLLDGAGASAPDSEDAGGA